MVDYIKQKPYYLNVPAGLPAGLLASIPQTNKSRSFMGIMDLLGAGLGVVSSIGSMIGQNRAIRQQIRAQQEENRKNREYNLMLARTQNQWNIEQWQRENDYNSPTAQMSRFRAAGLNPNLAYGQMSNGASSPTLTSGAASSPTDMSAIGNKRNFGQAMQESLNLEMQKAQIEAIKAGTEKTKEDTKNVTASTEALTIDNLYRAIKHQQDIKIGDMNLRIGDSTLKLNDNQLAQGVKTLEIMDKTLEEYGYIFRDYNAKYNLLIAQTNEQKRDTIRKDKQLDQFITNSYHDNKYKIAQTQLTLRQYNELCQTFISRLLNLEADTDSKLNSSVSAAMDIVLKQIQEKRDTISLTNEQWEALTKDPRVFGVWVPILSDLSNVVINGLDGMIPFVKVVK